MNTASASPHPGTDEPQASPERDLPPCRRYECVVYVCSACGAIRHLSTLMPPYTLVQAWCGCNPETTQATVEQNTGERL
jgi:hypothetical protein